MPADRQWPTSPGHRASFQSVGPATADPLNSDENRTPVDRKSLLCASSAESAPPLPAPLNPPPFSSISGEKRERAAWGIWAPHRNLPTPCHISSPDNDRRRR